MRRLGSIGFCLLPLWLLAAGPAIADVPEARDVALLSFDPSTAYLSVHQPATLSVIYDGSSVSVGLRGFSLEISYDDTYVYVDSLDVHVVEGDFLSDVGTTAFYVLPVDENTFVVDCAILGATTGATGVGELFSILFKGQSVGDGASPVEFTDVRLRDPDNNGIICSPAFGVLILDNTPPNVPTLDPEPEFTQGTTNTVSWSDESASGAVGYCVEAAETPGFEEIVGTSGCTPFTSYTFVDLTDGQIYYYRVKCRDELWNTSDWSASEHSTQDDTAPDTEAGPLDPYYNTISFDVPFSASDATSGVQYVQLFYQKDGSGYVQYGGTFTVSPIAFTAPGEGLYDFYTFGTDNVGNVEDAPVSPDCTTEVDLTPPPAVIDFVALPGHNKIHLSWTVPIARDAPIEGTLIVRRPWSIVAYPEYDDWGPPWGYPAHSSDGFVVAFVPGTGPQTYEDASFTDATRNVHYYTAFARDAAGNYSLAASTAQDRSTSYWLADVREPTWTPGTYDGFVDYYDKVAYSYSYYSSEGDPQYDAELDVGPTDDSSRMGIPLTDNVIDFEDLMILAMNYGRVSRSGTPGRPLPDWASAERVNVNLEHTAGGFTEGETVEVTISLVGLENSVQGASMLTTYDPSVLELVRVEVSERLWEVGEVFSYAAEESSGRVRVDLAVLGEENAMPGPGSLVTIQFRVLAADPTPIRMEEVVLRDPWNSDVSCATGELMLGGDGDEYDLPTAWRLAQNAPNPFNPRTSIAFDVPESCSVTLSVYDVSGRLLRVLAEGPRDAGTYTVMWDGRDTQGREVSSGVYFYVLEGPAGRLAQKMVLTR